MTITTEQVIGLPKGWSLVRLADVGSFFSGSGFPLVYQGNTAGDYPFFKVSDFSNPGNERTLNRANHYIDEDARKKIGARLFPQGAIAFAKIGAAIFLERKRIIDQASCLDNNMAGFVLNIPEISRELILAHLQSFSLGSLVSSTALPAINSTDLKSIAFPLPDDPAEQEAIAEALSDADALIEGLERLIAKKRLIKQGAMQDLLTARRRLPGFSGEWVERKLGEVARIATGSRNNQDKDPMGDFPFFVRSDNVERIRSWSYDCEAILVPGEGRIGEIFHYINGKFDVHQRVYCISGFTEDISGRFIHTILRQFFGKHAMTNTVKATVDSLRRPTFTGFTFLCPPSLAEQNAIAALLFDMDAEIQTLETRLEKARAVKEGMMQYLLTGRIRLV